eukprot:g7403.t1
MIKRRATEVARGDNESRRVAVRSSRRSMEISYRVDWLVWVVGWLGAQIIRFLLHVLEAALCWFRQLVTVVCQRASDDAAKLRLVELLMLLINVRVYQELTVEFGDKFFQLDTNDKKRKYIKERSKRLLSVAATEMTGFLQETSSKLRSYKKELRSTELHREILKQLFQEFNLSESNLKELECLLTNAHTKLNNNNIENGRLILDHLLFVNSFDKVQETELKTVNVRLLHIKVSEKAWQDTNKSSGGSKPLFEMDISMHTWTMNTKIMAARENEVKKFLSQCSGIDLKKC